MKTAVLKTLFLSAALIVLVPSVTLGQEAKQSKESKESKPASADVARGRYLAVITGCHDCHTPGYMQTGGLAARQMLLTGDSLGWRGPWGTTYPTNIRLYVQKISEDRWVERWRTGKARPPMPWMSLRAMKDRDLRALYRYVKTLGPAGEESPDYLPPDKKPETPFVQFPEPPKN